MTKEIRKRLLLADDDANLRRVVEFQLAEAGYDVATANDGAEALEKLGGGDGGGGGEFDCLVTDLRMPRVSGQELLEKVRALRPDLPVIVVTAFGEVETAVAAIKAGAFDYLNKPFSRDQILVTVERALAFAATKSENLRLRELLDSTFSLENVIGESEAMRSVMHIVSRVSRSDATVLLTGESGTGKEVVAKGIHFSGRRRDKPFIAINCAAIPENLIEAELFGYRRGSFTGAVRDGTGKFEAAEGGTIFLDEISQLPLPLQPKLLRVLQEQEVTRIGDSAPKKIDVRVIAATNQDLRRLSEAGAFRDDLFFRLSVVPIELPPLRARSGDIALLAAHFFRRTREKHGFADLAMDKRVVDALAGYAFPGNVRELENLIERMVVLSDERRITIDDLPDFVLGDAPPISSSSSSSATYSSSVSTSAGRPAPGGIRIDLPPEPFSLEALERDILARALERHHGNQSQTARYLGITRSALIYRIDKFGLGHGVAQDEKGEGK